jgi:hypothetical protein
MQAIRSGPQAGSANVALGLGIVGLGATRKISDDASLSN